MKPVVLIVAVWAVCGSAAAALWAALARLRTAATPEPEPIGEVCSTGRCVICGWTGELDALTVDGSAAHVHCVDGSAITLHEATS